MKPAEKSLTHVFQGRSLLEYLCLALLASLALGLTLLLWPHWQTNPDLSHGYFMPLLFVMLLHESYTAGRARYLDDSPKLSLATGAALLLALALLSFGALYALAFDLQNTMTASSIATAFAILGLAFLLCFSRKSVAIFPFNWTALVAFALWILSAPLPPGAYQKLSLTLQLGVTRWVISALQFLGIPAAQHGNIIELTRTTVGVEEACSGIRSLISCLFAGAFFSACVVRNPKARFILLLLAAPLAIFMNFLRSLILTLLANAGVNITGFWHDSTSYAILGMTALILGALALLLSRKEKSQGTLASMPKPLENRKQKLRAEVPLALGLALSLLILVSVATLTWPKQGSVTPRAPDLEALLPKEAPGWNVVSAGDLLRFRAILQTSNMVQRDYKRMGADGPTQITVYLAYWAPGEATPSQVAIHTPDGCWPGAGWIRIPQPISRLCLKTGSQSLPESEYRQFKDPSGLVQEVWYWHLYDKKPIEQLNPYAINELLKMSMRFGFHRTGEQLFVRFSSNRSWEMIRTDPLVSQIVNNLAPFGLIEAQKKPEKN